VNDVATVTVKIYTFLANRGTDENLGQQWSVEPGKDAVSGIHGADAAPSFDKRNKLLVT
jgi:hypothetical protein